MIGNDGNNTLIGNALRNTLVGGAGADILTGGDGAGMFVFSTALGAGNVDSVADFVLGSYLLQLAVNLFGGLGPSNQAVGASLFAGGAGMVAAADAATRIVFDTSTGNLYYDADGAGGAAAQWFATAAWQRPERQSRRIRFCAAVMAPLPRCAGAAS